MAKFTVYITQDYQRHGSVEVEAKSSDDAADLAFAMVDQKNVSINWEPDMTYVRGSLETIAE